MTAKNSIADLIAALHTERELCRELGDGVKAAYRGG
jgi:hypothetical protein